VAPGPPPRAPAGRAVSHDRCGTLD
jgi:hypothetical protein